MSQKIHYKVLAEYLETSISNIYRMEHLFRDEPRNRRLYDSMKAKLPKVKYSAVPVFAKP